jgi:hypothetical protein
MCLLVECILVENNRWKLRPSCNIGRCLDYHKIPNDDREDTLVRVSILCIPIRTWVRLGFVALHSQSVKFNCGAGTMSKSLESYEEIIEGFDSRERERRNRSANTPWHRYSYRQTKDRKGADKISHLPLNVFRQGSH